MDKSTWCVYNQYPPISKLASMNGGEPAPTLNTPINVGGEIGVEIISVGHNHFLVKVELTWVQDPGSFA
jgi:hypothetical protein